MGLLVNGRWVDQWYDTESHGGCFEREATRFHHWVTPDGAPGPTGEGGFPAESGRYHLYVSLACPWAHRTLILRQLKDLVPHIGVSIVHPHMLEHGWQFTQQGTGAPFEGIGDSLYGLDYLYQLYLKAAPSYSGRVTVPVLWDRKRETIVNNESAEILRMFNSAFNGLTGNSLDFYPEPLRPEIDVLNADIYDNFNNGVYRAGFATRQKAYEDAARAVFDCLDRLERRLADRRYLTGPQITEADWRLFTTLIRFDSVYHGHFKLNRRRILDYPNLWGYLRDLYQQPGVADTVNLEHIRQHYYYSHAQINPTRIVPLGPILDLNAPHGREDLARGGPGD